MEILIVVKNTYTTNDDGDANKPDDVDESSVCMCRVIIETRKREREREKRIEGKERAMRTNGVDDDDDGQEGENEEKKKNKKLVSYFSLTANQLHATDKRNGETAALSLSIHRICMYFR